MSHKKTHVDPRIHTHFLRAVQDERLAIFSLLKFQWPLVFLFFIGIVSLIYFARPLPPSYLRLATGQPNSSLDSLGKEYAELFKKNGVQLELINTSGANQNIDLLKKGKVDAAFSLGGMSVGDDAPNVVSLGSVEYQPFWLFYRGVEYDGQNPSLFFEGKTFSVNIPGSGTHFLTEKLLALHGLKIGQSKQLVSLSSGDSVEALRSGKIDGVFLVAGIDSKTIERILAIPDVQIFNFTVADAYAKRLKYLEVVNLPRRSIDLRRTMPLQSIQMVATTTTVLVDESLHPAIQQLFLEISKKIDDTSQTFFNRPGGFPAYIERSIPPSAVAERYYQKGPPALKGYVPYWVASFFDQIWFLLFAAFAVIYPLAKMMPNYRAIYSHFCMTDSYEDLTEVDVELMKVTTVDELKTALLKFDLLEKEINQLFVPTGLEADFYNLKNSVEIVRSRATRLESQFKEQDLSSASVPA